MIARIAKRKKPTARVGVNHSFSPFYKYVVFSSFLNKFTEKPPRQGDFGQPTLAEEIMYYRKKHVKFQTCLKL